MELGGFPERSCRGAFGSLDGTGTAVDGEEVSVELLVDGFAEVPAVLGAPRTLESDGVEGGSAGLSHPLSPLASRLTALRGGPSAAML